MVIMEKCNLVDMKSVRNSMGTISAPGEGQYDNALSIATESPICSFSGKQADFYIGLSGSGNKDEIRVIGAICCEFVETAIVNVMGKGIDDIQWPVILDLNKKICYHSYQAHTKGLSAIIGWKQFLGL